MRGAWRTGASNGIPPADRATYQIVQPPSITMSWPVRYAEPGDARKTTAAWMSSVLPIRPGRHDRVEPLGALLGLRLRPIVLLGPGESAGADVVDGHAMGRQPTGQVVGDAMDGVLGREVRRHVPVERLVQGRIAALAAVDRGDIDDPSPAALHHRRGEQLAQPERRVDVDGEDRPPFVERHLLPVLVRGDPDVVDQDVDLSGLLAAAGATSGSLVMSAVTTVASAPMSRTSAAVSSSLSRRRPTRTTSAPPWARPSAIILPRPVPEPVTRARRPASESIGRLRSALAGRSSHHIPPQRARHRTRLIVASFGPSDFASRSAGSLNDAMRRMQRYAVRITTVPSVACRTHWTVARRDFAYCNNAMASA